MKTSISIDRRIRKACIKRWVVTLNFEKIKSLEKFKEESLELNEQLAAQGGETKNDNSCGPRSGRPTGVTTDCPQGNDALVTYANDDRSVNLLGKYRRQESINNQQFVLAEGDYLRDKGLFENKVISAREFETKKKEYLNALNGLESVKITVSNAQVKINSIEKNILQLQIQDYQEQSKLKSEFQRNVKSLLSEINKWKQLYLIESPVPGRVSFFNIWTVNQNVKTGDELFYIVPSQTQKFIGKCLLPAANSGKLSLGQKVNIKLNNYPFNENGMLQGIVDGFSEVPNKDSYVVDVNLVKGLTTSYGKTLSYREQMKGKADIITKNLSVMERIFFNFKKLTQKL